MTLASITHTVSRKLAQNSPAILTALASAGVIATAVLTAKAAVNAHEEIRYVEGRYPEANEGCTLTPKEKVALTWKHFVPAFIVGSATIACVISAQSVNSRRNAALMSLYTMADRAQSEFMEKTTELHGENKVSKIREEIAKDRIESRDLNPAGEQPEGTSLAYDAWTDREFYASRTDIERAVNVVNAEINRNMFCSLNTYYRHVGLGEIPSGEDIGWNLDHPLDVEYTYHPARDGRPCMAVTFKRYPTSDYYSVR